MFDDLASSLAGTMPDLRGPLAANQPLAPYTWFRVGGPAQLLFSPRDEDDLGYFLARLPAEIPVTIVGLGSNLIVRDAGVPGVVIRLISKGFGEVERMGGNRLKAGAGAPSAKVARAAADAGIDGLAFFRGIPGSVGGALRMNAGAHGGDTASVFVAAHGVDRQGRRRSLTAAEMDFHYRHSSAPEDMIFTSAEYEGRPGEPAAILAEMERITRAREESQPIREKTGGSTFKNPPGHKAWQLIDGAGCRGLVVGDAEVSTIHCNFLINRGSARAAEIEELGETVRRRVRERSGIDLEWEIKRIGVAA